jgi:hypothetical protein
LACEKGIGGFLAPYYACRLNVNESNPETNVADFIRFLPVLAYDGSTMKQVDAAGVLDIAMSGTSATLLARRWESALLVNVDNATLARLMDNQNALDAQHCYFFKKRCLWLGNNIF